MEIVAELRKVASSLYSTLDTPVSLKCCILLRYKEWDQLASLSVDPRNYVEGPWGAAKYFKDSQACNFLRKSPLLPGHAAEERRKAAEVVFDECETMCASTNEFLKTLDTRRYLATRPEIEVRTVSILDAARKICTRILGRLPDDLHGRFGPGTSVELRGSVYKTVADKMYTTPLTTPAAKPLFELDYWRTHWGRRRLELGLPLPATCRGNYFTTVPKDATKDRGICVEPLGNLWCQLGIGGELKRRLSQVGLHVGKNPPRGSPSDWSRPDRKDGQYHHRKAAREGSLHDTWSTIDLSNASDTIAYELVRWVIPEDWFGVLDALRSPFTLFGDRWVKLHKFSSMGNGQTFELESLVFAALVAAATGLKVGSDVFSYGDDILVPGKHAGSALAILKVCGFTPNEKKSFTSGPFRESCGGDYFSGFDVRSCYADSEFQEPTDWIVLHNQLRMRRIFGPALHRCVQAIPVRLRLFGPPRLGDVVLHGAYKARRNRRGWLTLPVIQPSTFSVPLERWGLDMAYVMATAGYVRNGKSAVKPTLVPRGPPSGYRIRLASVS